MLWTTQLMEFSRPKYWIGEPFPFPGDHLDPEIKPASPTLADTFFTANATWEAHLRTPTQLRISSLEPSL